MDDDYTLIIGFGTYNTCLPWWIFLKLSDFDLAFGYFSDNVEQQLFIEHLALIWGKLTLI